MPGGGDCEGMTGAITSPRDMELPGAAGNLSATSMGAKPANTGVTVAGGTWGLAVQQPALTDPQGMSICEQQLCGACCVGSTQVPTDSSNTPIRVMATVICWLIPRSIV